ncbi:uncharacterized protein LOC133337764 [Musca vetustissima]|uniref:uncharacterized protein LOC133337764 n=1 Tax=Musca vetustissima TaxID=27455 RepID=UPI002AB78708|nr:uncharacterized protein LOC133337764 [Musca vetustissima]
MNYKIIVLLLIILPILQAKKKSRSVSFLDTRSDLNANFIKNLQINISRQRDSMSIGLEIVQDLTDVWATVGVGLWQKTGNKFRAMFSYDIDLCETLLRLKSPKIQLLNKWIVNFLKYGNLSSQCPFFRSSYYFSNLKVDKDSIPDYVPNGKFQTYLSLYLKKQDGSKEVINCSFMTFELK